MHNYIFYVPRGTFFESMIISKRNMYYNSLLFPGADDNRQLIFFINIVYLYDSELI